MRLLALETATEYCSVALLTVAADGQVSMHSVGRHAPRLQTELILPMVDELLQQTSMSLASCDAIAYSAGPGAFTGVRIAASVAQGLAFASDLPVVAVSSLQAQAQGVARLHGASAAVSCFDARMQEIYLGAYQLDANGLMQPLADEVVCRPNEAPELLCTAWANHTSAGVAAGSGWLTYGDELSAQLAVTQRYLDAMPEAQDVARLALPMVLAGAAKAPEHALPVYLRDDVWKKLPGR
ncbi:MAG: tRNA (adenosine(37)-N6)-threonylcarbamoyltransferase complex dimerization subunit type 1 TsaB [Moraxellaceae bacterium]|nr:tRNA (adenosine(37)-N6)-threonylcarbamoyltransferase complex dimerization subunit type 1 TsaB [Moraxellaceae bacterium]MDZ4385772.1 tRNA (adenosine(37)-N6)-threonylcarbamoyltransferase complex dimerization subunit type 1 TsaB [Moraxellaceae bacterium]